MRCYSGPCTTIVYGSSDGKRAGRSRREGEAGGSAWAGIWFVPPACSGRSVPCADYRTIQMAGTMAGWTVSTLMSPIELLKGPSMSLFAAGSSSSPPPHHRSETTNADRCGSKALLGPNRLCDADRARSRRPRPLARFRRDAPFPVLDRGAVRPLLFAWTHFADCFTSASYGTYEVVLRGCKSIPVESRWRPSDGTAVFLAGGLGSSMFWCFSFPFDSVKK